MNPPYMNMPYGALDAGDVFYADLKGDGEIGIASAVALVGVHAKITFVTQDGTAHIRRYPRLHRTWVLRRVPKHDRNALLALNTDMADVV